MRKALYSCLLVCFTVCAFGQLKDTIIKRDTINIMGVVYGYDAKPVKNIEVGLAWYKFRPPGYPSTVKTDVNGYFELKGADPYEYLNFISNIYHYVSFPIRGSRYLVIYLPKPESRELFDSVTIKAVRTRPKVSPSFNVKISTEKGFRDTYFELHPAFNGGLKKFSEYLNQHIVYPKAAVKNNIEGTVEVSFSFNDDSSLKDFKVLRGLGYGCEEEVIRQIKNAGKWKIGVANNKPYSVEQIVKVQFRLVDK